MSRTTLLAIAFAAILIAVITYVSGILKTEELYQTNLYCFESSSQEKTSLFSAISKVAKENRYEIVDRSGDVSQELKAINRPRSAGALHGVVRRNGMLVATFSNLGSNDRIFHLSFYTEDYHRISQQFDEGIRAAVSPLRAKTISGGAFDDGFCGS